MTKNRYFTKRDMLDRLEIEFMRGKDSDLFEQTAALWSADQVTSDKGRERERERGEGEERGRERREGREGREGRGEVEWRTYINAFLQRRRFCTSWLILHQRLYDSKF